jgi:two-component system response regulator NreC
MIRVLIADDHNLFIEGISSLLEDINNIKIIGCAENGRSLEKKYFDLLPDVIITDISMPIKNGPEAVENILRKNRNCKVLFISQHTGDDYIYSIIKSGGKGFLSKSCSKEDLVLAIEAVYKGKLFFVNKTEQQIDEIVNRFDSQRSMNNLDDYHSLTSKQKEVLGLIGEGFNTQEIARKLEITKRTVDTHRQHIMNILGLHSLPKLVRYAVMGGNEKGNISKPKGKG